MHRPFQTITAGVLAFGVLATGTSLAFASSSQHRTVAQVNLVMAVRWTGAPAHAVATLLQMYEKTHPGVHVILQEGVTSQKLLAEVAAGNPPNVAMLNTTNYVPTFAAKGAILYLQPFIQRSHLNMNQFTPASLYSNSLLGHQYAMPFFEDTYAMYYNKTLLAKAGIHQPPQTLQQLLADARKTTILGRNGQYSQLGFEPSFVKSSEAYLFGGRWASPAGQLTATSPAVVKGETWLVNYWHMFGPSKVERFISSNAGAPSSLDPFTSGKVAMMISGEWYMPNIIQEAPHMNYGVAPIPYPAGYPQYEGTGSVGGNPLVIPKGASNVTASWNLIDWFTTTGEKLGVQPKLFSEILAVPALKSLVNDPRLAPNPQMAFFWKYSEGNNVIPFPAIPDSTTLSAALDSNLQLAQLGKESVKQALQNVQNQYGALIANDLKTWRASFTP